MYVLACTTTTPETAQTIKKNIHNMELLKFDTKSFNCGLTEFITWSSDLESKQNNFSTSILFQI